MSNYMYRVTYLDSGYWISARSGTFKGIHLTLGDAMTAITTARSNHPERRHEFRVERAPLGEWEVMTDV